MFSGPAGAAFYSSRSGFNPAAPDIVAFKPTDLIFPGFLQPGSGERPEGHRGFSGFVNEIRGAVQSSGGSPFLGEPGRPTAGTLGAGIQATDPTFESSIPIRIGRNGRFGGTIEVALGVTVKQVVEQIPTVAPGGLGGLSSSTRRSRGSGAGSPSGSVGGGISLSEDTKWLGGGFLAGNSGWGNTGFGFEMQPMTFPSNFSTGPYPLLNRKDPGTEKSLKALRKMVLDLFFNPFVYFGALVISVLMFMARIRRS